MATENTIVLAPEDAQRLADALIRRRIELGYRSARALGQAMDMDARTITALEGARRTSVSRNTLTALEVALKWDPGYIKVLIESGRGSRNYAEEQRVYIATVSATEEEVRVARAVAQAAFESTLASLRSADVRQ